MNTLNQSILNGTAQSVHGSTLPNPISIVNNTELTIDIFRVNYSDNQVTFIQTQLSKNIPLGAGKSLPIDDSYEGAIIFFKSTYSGAFIGALTVDSETTVITIDSGLLNKPNDIGLFPQPSSKIPIPVDSNAVMVGYGVLANNNFVTREQYWRRAPESYCLAPSEERVVSFNEVSGMEQTSSDQTTISESAGASVSGGWGPVSANVSASLSKTTSHMQQMTVKTESTRYTSIDIKNEEDYSQLYLKWQLMDVYNFYNPAGQCLSSLVQGERPILVASYNMQSWDPINSPSDGS